MARCCGGASCACLIQSSGSQISITGSGQASDPYIIHGGVALGVVDNSVFDLSLTGAGTTASPWALSANFAASAKLDDLPDVVATAPTNGQVLGWDAPTSKWTPRAPTTAASGSVQHDTALTGDGSAGTPLGINEDTNGYLATAATGLGLSDTGKNRIIRHYANSTIRAAASPTPDLNTLTMLDSTPGRIDYWNGSAWIEYRSYSGDIVGQLLSISGAYTGTTGKVTLVVRQVSTLTDGFGMFDILSTTDLSGRAGVIGCWFQPTLSSVFAVVLETTATSVRGHAYNVADGSSYLNQNVAGSVLALVY